MQSASARPRLTRRINFGDTVDGNNRLLHKNLLAEAGSSPRTVSHTLTRFAESRELSAELHQEVADITGMARDIAASRKNEVLLKLLGSTTAGKVIIFVKFLGTLQYVSEFLFRHRISHGHRGKSHRKSPRPPGVR